MTSGVRNYTVLHYAALLNKPSLIHYLFQHPDNAVRNAAWELLRSPDTDGHLPMHVALLSSALQAWEALADYYQSEEVVSLRSGYARLTPLHCAVLGPNQVIFVESREYAGYLAHQRVGPALGSYLASKMDFITTRRNASLQSSGDMYLTAKGLKEAMQDVSTVVQRGSGVSAGASGIGMQQGMTLLRALLERISNHSANYSHHNGTQILNTGDAFGNTALHWAASWGLASTALLLCQRGADPLVENTSGNTPFDLAFMDSLDSTAQLYFHCTAEPMHHVVRQLPSNNATDNARRLQRAVLSILRHLAAMNPRDLDTRDEWGATPLSLAIERQSQEAVEVLLAHGARADKLVAVWNYSSGVPTADQPVTMARYAAGLHDQSISHVLASQLGEGAPGSRHRCKGFFSPANVPVTCG